MGGGEIMTARRWNGAACRFRRNLFPLMLFSQKVIQRKSVGVKRSLFIN